MTSKEAVWLVKQSCQNIRVELRYKGIECTNILRDDISDFEYLSEHNFANPFFGLYTWYDNRLEPVFVICIRDKLSKTVYEVDCAEVEFIKK